MKPVWHRTISLTSRPSRVRFFACLAAIALFGFGSACESIERPVSEPYFAEVVTPPAKREFRWTNGRLPRSFDPALAVRPPETDIARAMFECLTATDPKTLEAVPAAADQWTATEDNKTWTFNLRKDARWSNGKPVTAHDFVRAWNRLIAVGSEAIHSELLRNFSKARQQVVTRPEVTPTPWNSEEPPPLLKKPEPSDAPDNVGDRSSAKSNGDKRSADALAVRAESDHVLSVTLENGNIDLPKLVASPIFSPVYGDGTEFGPSAPPNAIVSNGPFRISGFDGDGVTLTRSEYYHDKDAIQIDTVRFVASETPNEALDAYRSGKVDAVTNAEFEPTALKVLSPYQDFRKATHGALNLYELNTSRPPFNDRHVREALAISIERERLTEGEMEGATRPAFRLLPIGGRPVGEIVQDVDRARILLADAGYPDGKGFPVIRLVVNRNDAQQRIARAVARMWKDNLGLETEIIVKETSEMAEVRKSGDFDMIRRGVVFASSDPNSNLSAIFDPQDDVGTSRADTQRLSNANSNISTQSSESRSSLTSLDSRSPLPQTESQALYDFNVIPLYFPASYSLVKPYVEGFEPNGLDVVSFKDLRINSDWQPRRRLNES